MSDDWPVSINGREFRPVPESWIEHGSDQNHGSPRVYAVSVASGARDMIVLRYASRDGRVYRVETRGAESPTEGGIVPSSLATYHDWPRSLVPSRNVDSADVLCAVESEHMRVIWRNRLESPASAESGDQLIADGGLTQWSPPELGLDFPAVDGRDLEAKLAEPEAGERELPVDARCINTPESGQRS